MIDMVSTESMKINRKMPLFIFLALRNDPRCISHEWKDKVLTFYENCSNPEKFVSCFKKYLGDASEPDPIAATFSEMHKPIILNWNL